MSLSQPVPREHIHTRHVECRGFRRADGLWDVEGRLTDVKSYSFHNSHRGEIAPGTPVHDMWLRLTVDDDLTIHAVEAVTDSSPFRACPGVTPNFQRLIGLSIRSGFKRKVRERLGGTQGCTHLVELLGSVATTAFQTVFPIRNRSEATARGGDEPNGAHEGRLRPQLIDTCHAFASDGEVVKESWPDYYTGKDGVESLDKL
jgi:hypothetical protein